MRGRRPVALGVVALGLALVALAAVASRVRARRPRHRHRRLRAPHDRARHPGRPARPRRALGVAAALSLPAGAARRARRDDERRALGQRRALGRAAGACSSRTCAARRGAATSRDGRRERDRRCVAALHRRGVPHRDADGHDGPARAALRAARRSASRSRSSDGATAPRRRCSGAAVMLRYEAWAIARDRRRALALGRAAAAEAAHAAAAPASRRAGAGATRGSSWSLPVALILVWAALRRPVDGRWFGFLGQTHEFASQAVDDARRLPGPRRPRARRPLLSRSSSPCASSGPPLPLAAFGVARTVRQQGPRFVLVLAACLGFVSLTWVMRSSLGLDRHFVVRRAALRHASPRRACARSPTAGAMGEPARERASRRASPRAPSRRPRSVASAGGARRRCSTCGWASGAARSSADGRSARRSARTSARCPPRRRSSATTRRSRS